uniref:Uncharacterized protein n=1 Tax=Oryza glumipatula TaxID=40148 RepID=A0A0E0A4N7_9ORYZ
MTSTMSATTRKNAVSHTKTISPWPSTGGGGSLWGRWRWRWGVGVGLAGTLTEITVAPPTAAAGEAQTRGGAKTQPAAYVRASSTNRTFGKEEKKKKKKNRFSLSTALTAAG